MPVTNIPWLIEPCVAKNYNLHTGPESGSNYADSIKVCG